MMYQVPRRSYQSFSTQQRLDALTGAIVYKDPVLVEVQDLLGWVEPRSS
jgi:hypothetical protein